MPEAVDLDRELEALAEGLDTASRPTTAAQAMVRRAPAARSRHGVRLVVVGAVAVASIVLGVAAMVVSHGAHDRVETGDPASLGPPPSTAPGSNGSTPGTGPTLTGMPFDQLPARGIVVVQHGRTVLLDFQGDELASGPAPDVFDPWWLDPQGLAVLPADGAVVVGPGRDTAGQAPAGCESFAGGEGLRVALCGGETQLRRRIDRVQPDGTRSTLADGAQAVGHWAGALPAPDGRWVLGQWSGECEVPTAYVVPADGGDPQPLMVDVDGVVPETFGLGWAPDGRAVVWALAGSCGTGVNDPGVYLVDPDTRQVSLIIDVRARDGMDAVAAGVWTREAGDPQPLS